MVISLTYNTLNSVIKLKLFCHVLLQANPHDIEYNHLFVPLQP